MQDRVLINRALGKLGLGQLEDGAGLLSQLGFLVEDHEHFRQMLAKCDPENRRAMYESMKPYLRFEARALDQYISESARIAEQRQWPLLARDGKLHPFRAPEVRTDAPPTDEDLIRDLVAQTVAKGHLHLVCKRCTAEAVFPGVDRFDAVWAARSAGWTYDEVKETGCEICPTCLAKLD